MTTIALNGLGRIGKLALRELCNREHSLAWVNDAAGDPALHAHLLEFDTVHGRWTTDVDHDDDGLRIDGRHLPLYRETALDRLPLDDVDVVIDCTGVFKTEAELAPYFDAGVKRVIVSAPVKDGPTANLVYGVNHETYRPDEHRIVTAASCTTNCLAPLVKVLHEGLGIRHGSITTIHSVTNSQTIVDRAGSDLRRSRSALNALIPTSTGSATAITYIYPELKGRLDGHAVRVPLLNASLTDAVFELERPTTVDAVNALFERAAAGPLAGVLGYETRPLVSTDFTNDTRSAIVDALSTMVVNDTQVKLYAWYDNEMGYTHRIVDLVEFVVSRS